MLPVIEGTEVVQGQLLARVRRRFKAAQVEQAQTALQLARSGASQLQADLALSYRELTRHRQPFERKLACVPIFTPAAVRLVYIPSLLSQPLHALPQRKMVPVVLGSCHCGSLEVLRADSEWRGLRGVPEARRGAPFGGAVRHYGGKLPGAGLLSLRQRGPR